MFYILPIVILVIWCRIFTFGTSLSDAPLVSFSFSMYPFSPCLLITVAKNYVYRTFRWIPSIRINLSVLHHVQGFWIKTFSGEECWSNLAMAIRRLLCSWRISGTSTGRVSKVLVIRDSCTQQSLFVLGLISDGSGGWKQLGANAPFQRASLSTELEVLLPIIAGKTPSSSAPRIRQSRGTSSRNLLPRIRSKFRTRVRHRERVHFRGRWHPLWRRYAEVADLQRVQHILTGYFYRCVHNFIALMESQPVDLGRSATV